VVQCRRLSIPPLLKLCVGERFRVGGYPGDHYSLLGYPSFPAQNFCRRVVRKVIFDTKRGEKVYYDINSTTGRRKTTQKPPIKYGGREEEQAGL